ncbi:TetR family transcriptional regulator [Hamadaea sp. NPDC050747]|uniref:TetR/AcrR family transcriptional regulator n=1 Tax=Hamadaea sp. NPDC050747 TaxID=3155789 RepID=UPI0033E8BDDB
MRSAGGPARGDLTARAHIRDHALALFAERGPDAVSMRDIAAAAGVSPALVVHHYGSKLGLRHAVDEHVVAVFDDMFAAGTTDPGMLDLSDAPAAATSFAELMLAHLPPGSPIPAYLRRLLLSGDEAGRQLFKHWFAASVAMMEQLTAAGVTKPSDDVAVRAAFLMVNDLAMVLLHDHLADVLGVDPLSPAGIRRWSADVVAAYAQGVFALPPGSTHST